MKILQLRFKNINSLYGEWLIDFTSPCYVEDGIFAITGPTGAGKSTLLDALCLALYGRTPRLGRLTQTDNEVMSRHTAECFAEVLFQTAKGTFRAHWSQHRARKKLDGNLVDAKHEVANAINGDLLESKKSLVLEVIEQLTGMDFQHFCRAMLLAQGSFASFLQAPANEKAPILEQITGTEIYARISQQVHQRVQDQQVALQLLQAKQQNHSCLSEEQVTELNQEIKVHQSQVKQLKLEQQQLVKAQHWLSEIKQLEKELAQLTEHKSEYQKRSESFKPQLDKLQRALNLLDVEPVHTQLNQVKSQKKQVAGQLKTQQQTLVKNQHRVEQSQSQLITQQTQLAKLKQQFDDLLLTTKQIDKIDTTLQQKQSLLLQQQQNLSQQQNQLTINQQQLANLSRQQQAIDEKINQALQFQQRHKADEVLQVELAVIESDFTHVNQLHSDIQQREKLQVNNQQQLTALNSQHKQLSKGLDKIKQQQSKAAQKCKQINEKISALLAGKKLADYQEKKELLHQQALLVKKVADLEQERRQLIEGNPCPLCGSQQHPFAQGNIPEMDGVQHQIAAINQTITTVEKYQHQLNKVDSEQQQLLLQASKLEQQIATTVTKQQSVTEALDLLILQLEEMNRRHEKNQLQLLQKLIPLGVNKLELFDLKKMQQRLIDWQLNEQQLEKYNESKLQCQQQFIQLDSTNKQIAISCNSQQKSCNQLEREYNDLKKQRQQVFGDKETKQQLQLLTDAVKKSETLLSKSQQQVQQNKITLSNNETMIASLNKQNQQLIKDCDEVNANFTRLLEQFAINDEAHYLKLYLSREQCNELQRQADELKQQQTVLSAREQDKKQRFQMLSANKLTELDLLQVTEKLTLVEQALDKKIQQLAACEHQLKQHQTNFSQQQQHLKQLEQLQQSCRHWQKLHQLIGSADGKKYRNFAQGITFDCMVHLANQQLTKMSERYLLVHDSAQPLSLNVIDNYQAGELRSTKNLSGGESFLVSLALALGLSQLSSERVRIDSLFLDEGFGTLDEESLQVALDALSQLHHHGKTIGIISHVSELKQRIATQINVIPQANGRSHLQGPGCRLIS